jgi:hypothetical protein
MSEVQAERSRLLNRQKKDRTELEKDVKKKKGALKETAQAKLDQLEADHARELSEFDLSHGLASGAQPDAPVAAAPSKRSKLPTDLEWSELSKKELQEECAQREISKGGGKEDLVTRLICWAAEETARRANTGDDEDDESESSDEEEEDEFDSDSDLPDMTDDQKVEAEKQYKRELIVRKAILHLFESRFPEGFPLDDLPDVLARIKVVNFKPESLGYATLHEFARKQPRDAIYYDKGIRFLKPAAKRK